MPNPLRPTYPIRKYKRLAFGTKDAQSGYFSNEHGRAPTSHQCQRFALKLVFTVTPTDTGE
jgi:hypothetical protein